MVLSTFQRTTRETHTATYNTITTHQIANTENQSVNRYQCNVTLIDKIQILYSVFDDFIDFEISSSMDGDIKNKYLALGFSADGRMVSYKINLASLFSISNGLFTFHNIFYLSIIHLIRYVFLRITILVFHTNTVREDQYNL